MRRLQVALVGIGVSGSSLSSSSRGSGVEGLGGGAIEEERFSVAAGVLVDAGTSEIGFSRGSSSGRTSFVGCAGVSSTVECFPVVHGGISRNSSKVRTRGLQHFQPKSCQSKLDAVWTGLCLPF